MKKTFSNSSKSFEKLYGNPARLGLHALELLLVQVASGTIFVILILTIADEIETSAVESKFKSGIAPPSF